MGDPYTLCSRARHIASVRLPAFFAIFPLRHGANHRFDEANIACLRVIDRDPRRFLNVIHGPGWAVECRHVKAERHQGGAGLWVASSVDGYKVWLSC